MHVGYGSHFDVWALTPACCFLSEVCPCRVFSSAAAPASACCSTPHTTPLAVLGDLLHARNIQRGQTRLTLLTCWRCRCCCLLMGRCVLSAVVPAVVPAVTREAKYKGDIFMVFDYAQHDLTGMMDAMKATNGLTAPHVRVVVGVDRADSGRACSDACSEETGCCTILMNDK